MQCLLLDLKALPGSPLLTLPGEKVNGVVCLQLNLIQKLCPQAKGQAADFPVCQAEDFQIVPGSRMTVNVNLDNVVDFTAFQTDINVSEGLSIHHAGQDDAFTPSDTRLSTSHIIDSYLHETDAFRVIGYSSENTPIAGSEGTLFTFDIVADDDFIGPGAITLSRTLCSTAEGEEFRLADAVCTIKKALRGDVNGDGVVNVADINAVVNIILGGHASAEVLKRADVNGDGNITISDINVLISLILS